jgi:hypothetical protein
MGLMDEISKQDRSIRYSSKLAELKDKLSPEDFADFMDAINNPRISQSAIRRVLQARGIMVGSGTLSRLRSELNEVQ